MATYENRYSVRNIPNGRKVRHARGCTLYEAWKELKSLVNAGAVVSGDAACVIARDSRPVAFWCFWKNEVSMMHTATPEERRALGFDL